MSETLETGLALQDLSISDSIGNKLASGTEVVSGKARVMVRALTGDNNANDRLDVGDATRIQRLLVGLDRARAWDIKANDLNGSGDLDPGDVTKVLRTVVGLDPQPHGNRSIAKMGGDDDSVEKVELSIIEKTGDTVTVQVKLKEMQGTVSGANFELKYPAELLKLKDKTSHKAGEMVAKDARVIWKGVSEQDGTMAMAASSPKPWETKDGVLAQVSFEVQEGADLNKVALGLSPVEVSPDGFDNRMLAGLELNVGSGEVKEGTAVPVLADVILSGLNHTYDGSAKSATVTTDPAGLNVVMIYTDLDDGGAVASPTEVGEYAVMATVSDENYKGSASGTLTIVKGDEGGGGNEGTPVTAEVTLTGLGQTYDGSAKEVTATTDPAGLNVMVTYTDSEGTAVASPTNAGIYTVKATVDDANNEGSATGTLAINKAQAGITVSGTSHTYDESAKEVTVTTDPAGLNVVVIYTDSEGTIVASPTEVGEYAVVATVDDGNYQGSTSVTLSIVAASGGDDPFGDPVTYTNIATTLIGQVTIDGTAARDGDVVAIYVGEELRGKQEVIVDEGTAWLNAQVHAAGGEETATFRVYEASTGITHDKVGLRVEIKPDGVAGAFDEPLLIRMDNVAPELTLLGEAQVTIDQGTTYVDAGASATDNVDGDLTGEIEVSGEVDASVAGAYTLKYDVSDAAGNAAESVSRTVVVEKTTVVQTLDLKVGWNLISFYVESDDMTPATVLGSVKDKLVQIKNLKNSYNPTLPAFINTLKRLNVKDGYWVKMDADVSFELEGEVPAGGSIPVRTGWNLVGYPRESGAAPANELTSLGGTVLQFKNLKNSYDPTLPAFINTLKVITPGLGYWLKVSEDGVWNVGDVSGEGGNRDIVKMGLGESRWGQVVVYPNVSVTVLAEVTVAGKAVSRGSVVGVFVKEELRGLQEVVLADGRSYVAINVNLAEAERVRYRIWDAGSDREYGVSKTMTLEMGEMYGTATELVKLDGVVADSGMTIRIVGYEREPFGFGFESQMGSSYVVEATDDLKEWGVVKTYNGTGTLIQFEDERDQVFPQIYYRVRVVE